MQTFISAVTVVLAMLASGHGVGARTLNVVNNCDFTIWCDALYYHRCSYRANIVAVSFP